eukprot:COSAG01_NODE_83_length_27807_cov_20.014581_4_plen_98_part_00
MLSRYTDMVAHNEREYFATAVRMLTDDAFRLGLKARISESRILRHEFARDNPREFDYVAAFRYLLDNHDSVKGSSAPTLAISELCDIGAYTRNCSSR